MEPEASLPIRDGYVQIRHRRNSREYPLAVYAKVRYQTGMSDDDEVSTTETWRNAMVNIDYNSNGEIIGIEIV